MKHRLISACAVVLLASTAHYSAAHEDTKHEHAEPAHEHQHDGHSHDEHRHGGHAHAAAASASRIQHNLIGSDFPIARAVEVPPGTQLVWHSGTVPSPANPDAERSSAGFWGDTKAQSLSVLQKMEASLKELGLSFDDIVKMTVYLVPDPNKGDRIDFDGFMQAYTQYYGANAGRMNLPARSAVGVAQLVAPGMLVEIDAVFARPAH